ncbi:MAG: hypothetical protein ACOCVG_03545 [Verrucomicrobiota bacterium]
MGTRLVAFGIFGVNNETSILKKTILNFLTFSIIAIFFIISGGGLDADDAIAILGFVIANAVIWSAIDLKYHKKTSEPPNTSADK